MTFCKVYDIYKPTEIKDNGEVIPSKCGINAHASTLTELPDGRIMVAWYCGSREKGADVGIYYSIFDPKKEDWTEPELLEKESNKKSEGNPVLFYDDKTQRLWFWWVTMDRAEYKHFPGGWSTCKVKVRHSDDLGKSWTPTRYLTKTWGRMTRNKPIRMSNDEVIFPFYSEWLGYKSNFWIASPEEFAKGALKCKWKKIGPIKGNVMQPNVVELDDKPGHLLCYMRSAAHSPQYPYVSVSESFDYGRHWTKVRKGPVYNCNSGLGLTKLKNGHLVLAFNNSPKERNPLSIAISEDGGKTWPYIRDLEFKEGGRFAYPEIIQAKDGTIYCSYTNDKGINIRCAHFDEEWVKEK